MFFGHFREARGDPDSGVVDQNVHASEIPENLFCGVLNAFGFFNVHDVGADISAFFAQVRGDGFRFVDGDVGESDGDALFTEFFRGGASDPSRSACDDCNSIFKFHLHFPFGFWSNIAGRTGKRNDKNLLFCVLFF